MNVIKKHGIMLIAVLGIASSYAPLSIDFFAPFIPSVIRDQTAAPAAVQVTLYLFFIGYGLSPFVWGRLIDRCGRRPIMLLGMSIYIIASISSMFVSDMMQISILRFFQGVAAASGVIVARAVMRDIHGAEGVTKAISNLFLIVVCMAIISPLAGGLVAEKYPWHISYLFMAIVGLFTLLGCIIWQKETMPEKPTVDYQHNVVYLKILGNAMFSRHALANMFCVTTLLLFVTNYSVVSEKQFQFSAVDNGYLLGFFNACVATGIGLTRVWVPRLGIKRMINLGLSLALLGWFLLCSFCFLNYFIALLMAGAIILAAIGTGCVISLTAGQALIPFSNMAGSASALYVCIQAAGSSLICFLIALLFADSLKSLTIILLVCSLLAIASMGLIRAKTDRET